MHRRQVLAGLAAAAALPGCSLLDGSSGRGRRPITDWLVAPKPNHVPLDYSAGMISPRRRSNLYRKLGQPVREEFPLGPLGFGVPTESVDTSLRVDTRTNDRLNGYQVVLGSFDEATIVDSLDPDPAASHGPFEIRDLGSGSWIATDGGRAVIVPGFDPDTGVADVEYVLDTGLGNREQYVDRFPDADRLLRALPRGHRGSIQVGEDGNTPLYDVGYSGSSRRLDGDTLRQSHVVVTSDGEAPSDEYRQAYVNELAGDQWSVAEDSFSGGVLTVELERPLEELTTD